MRRVMPLLSALILLTACSGGPTGGNKGQAYSIYYAVTQPDAQAAIATESHVISSTGEPVEQLMNLLVSAPESVGLTSPIPTGVSVNGWSLQEGVLHLELSEGYGGLAGIDLTIADYCITLTLCQLDTVRSVIISVDGDLVPSRYYQALRSSDVLLSAMEDDPVFLAVDLYYPRIDGKGMGSEQRDVLTGGDITRSAAVVNALIEGPMTEGLLSLMPEGVTLLSTSVENSICYVDFSTEFEQAAIADTAGGKLLLYSVVNTLCSLSGVEEVQLLIEGEAPASYGGVPTVKPLEPDYSLAKR